MTPTRIPTTTPTTIPTTATTHLRTMTAIPKTNEASARASARRIYSFVFRPLILLCLLAAHAFAGANVVFILVDDMGWADTGPFGNTYHRTPNIDRLARRRHALHQRLRRGAELFARPAPAS